MDWVQRQLQDETKNIHVWNPVRLIGWRQSSIKIARDDVNHYGLVMPYSNIDLGQHWLGQWLAAWRHQAITWANVDLPSVRASDIHLRAILQKIHQPPIIEISLKTNYLKFR